MADHGNDKQTGTAKTVNVSGITLNGADSGNYSLISTSAATSANISARSLTVNASGINKSYDGTTQAAVNLSDNRIAGDNLTVGYSDASFDSPNAGIGKAVTVNGIFLSGPDAGNYFCNTTAETLADITAVTPVFSNLSHPVIFSKTPETSLGGIISGNSPYPTGSVDISLNGFTQSAPISAVNGQFSAVFKTAGLTVEGSPYIISYSYSGDANYNALSPDTSQGLTITQRPVAVGGEVCTINKPALLAPWSVLFAPVLIGCRLLASHRRSWQK